MLLIGSGKLERLAADRKIQIASRVVNRIPDRLGVQPLQAEMPQIGIARIDRCVVRDLRRIGLRGESVGVRGHYQPVQPLHARSCAPRIRMPDSRAISDCEGMPPSSPKSLVTRCNPSPKCHPQMRFTATRANSGFSGGSQPLDEPFAPAVAKIQIGRLKWKPRLNGLVHLRLLRIAGSQHVALLLQ